MSETNEQILYESTGVLRYSRGETGSYKLVVEVDGEIARYYRALIPRWIRTNPQMYGAHVSVVRKEEPVNVEHWGRYDGHEVEFHYSPVVHFGEVYCWLNVWCERLEEVRLELGLPVESQYTRPPDGFAKTFHCTLGNFKTLVQKKPE